MLNARFSLPLSAIALEETVETVPELTAEADRTAADSTEWVMPGLWVTDAPFEAVDDALAADPTVETIVDDRAFDEAKWYQIEWSKDVLDRFDDLLDRQATILESCVDADGWEVTVRFASREQFDAFRSYLAERDVSFDLLELSEPDAARQSFGGLTPQQRDAMVTAVESGYYDIPRAATLREVATDLDISHQTLSEHLRRGTRKLVESTLTIDADHTA